MNTKQFATMFFAFIALVGVGTATFVTEGLAVTLPLVSATAGTLSLPLAVLGVLKLAAAASFAFGLGATNLLPFPLAANQAANPAAAGFNYRQKRSAAAAESNDAVFALVSSMDLLSCGKALICGLQTRNPATLAEDEKLMLTLFADRKTKKMFSPISAKAEYELASELGLATRNEVVCRKRYSTCPYTADEMMDALRNSRL